MPQPNKIVNPASVPHRSPFRYPGGKTWLVPRVRQWLASHAQLPAEFIEPFAGGAIVGLTVAFEKLAEHITLCELDEQVAAVWQTIIDGDAEWLANHILQFDLESESVDNLLADENPDVQQRALQTIVKNRVNRGGILADGAGRLKYGENGRGISSRWYPETLHRRILNILAIRERIDFIPGDGGCIIEEHAAAPDAVFFVDPPYTAGGKKAGKRLYNHWEIDHERLFDLITSVAGDFLMTYSNSAEVHDLAESRNLDTQPIAMKNTHHAEMTELLIGRDLDWMRRLE